MKRGDIMFYVKDVRYKDILNISELTIPDKKVTSIVGESGSGKTTLIRLLNKLISYDKGEIYYKNESIEKINSIELRRKVVMLPQSPVTFSGNIKDNLLIGLVFSEKPKVKDSKLKEILRVVCLKKELYESVDKLSGGEKQRICLGRVLLMEPEVLLLDEPTSALDEETENLVMENVKEYAMQNGITIIMVTHSRNIAEEFSDFIIEIKHGRVLEKRRL